MVSPPFHLEGAGFGHDFICPSLRGPSRTEAEHPSPRFGQSMTVDKVLLQTNHALPKHPLPALHCFNLKHLRSWKMKC